MSPPHLMKEILPQQRWIDLEVYYSCGQNTLSYAVDELQGLPIRGNLSTMWAAKGFQALYKVTRDKAHLDAGAKVVDYLSFSQASWDPHYIYTANPFGGCTADKVDTATWLDARQCDLVQPFIWYGLEQRGDAFHVTVEGRLSELKRPWEKPYEVELKVRGKKDLSLYLNRTRAMIEERDGFLLIRCKVAPDGSVSIPSK